MATVYEERANIFKALGDAKRQRIVELLQAGEKCACVLIDEMRMPQSSLSYHMRILCQSGIVTGREAGKWTYYKISRPGSKRAIELLQEITTAEERESDGSECCCCGDCCEHD